LGGRARLGAHIEPEGEMSSGRNARTADMAEWGAVALGAALALGLMLLGPLLAHAVVL
jgi:hypothetical protein